MSTLPPREDMRTAEDDSVSEKESEKCEPPIAAHKFSNNLTQIDLSSDSKSSPDGYPFLRDNVDLNIQNATPDSGEFAPSSHRNDIEKSSAISSSQRDFVLSDKESGVDGIMLRPAGLESDVVSNELPTQSVVQLGSLPEQNSASNENAFSEFILGERHNNYFLTSFSNKGSHKIEDEMHCLSYSTPVIEEVSKEVEAPGVKGNESVGLMQISAFERSIGSEVGNKEERRVEVTLPEIKGEGILNSLPEVIHPSNLGSESVLKDGEEFLGDGQSVMFLEPYGEQLNSQYVGSSDAVSHENQSGDLRFQAEGNENYGKEGDVSLAAQLINPGSLDTEHVLVEGVIAENGSINHVGLDNEYVLEGIAGENGALISSGSVLKQTRIQDVDSVNATLSGSLNHRREEHEKLTELQNSESVNECGNQLLKAQLAQDSIFLVPQANKHRNNSAGDLLNESESMKHRARDYNLGEMILINGELHQDCGNVMQNTKIPIYLEASEEKADRKRLMETFPCNPIEPHDFALLGKVSKDEGKISEPKIAQFEFQEEGILSSNPQVIKSKTVGRESAFKDEGFEGGRKSSADAESFTELVKLDTKASADVIVSDNEIKIITCKVEGKEKNPEEETLNLMSQFLNTDSLGSESSLLEGTTGGNKSVVALGSVDNQAEVHDTDPTDARLYESVRGNKNFRTEEENEKSTKLENLESAKEHENQPLRKVQPLDGLGTHVSETNVQYSNFEGTALKESGTRKDTMEDSKLDGMIIELRHGELDHECESMMQNIKMVSPTETLEQEADRKSLEETFPHVSLKHAFSEKVAKEGATIAESDFVIHSSGQKDSSIVQESSPGEVCLGHNGPTNADVNDQSIDDKRNISEELDSGFSATLEVDSDQADANVVVFERIGSIEEMEIFVDAAETLETCSLAPSIEDDESLDGTHRSASESMEVFLNALESETEFNEQGSEVLIQTADSEDEARKSEEFRRKEERYLGFSPDMGEKKVFDCGLRYKDIQSVNRRSNMASTFVEDLKAPSPEAWQETETFEETEGQAQQLNHDLILESNEQNSQTQKKLNKLRTPLRSLLAEEAETVEHERMSTSDKQDDHKPIGMWENPPNMEKPKPRSFWSHCICCPAVN